MSLARLALRLRVLSLALTACASASEPAPSPAASAGPSAGPPAASSAEAPAPAPAPTAPVAPAAGPSLVIQAEELGIDHPLAPGSQSPFYEASLDPSNVESGRATMRLASTPGATSTGFGATTALRLVDGAFTGRRYRMRARIKTEDAATSAWLWWRIDTKGSYRLDNMSRPAGRRLHGTNDWQEVALVMDVPDDARDFAFGSGLTGTGTIWVSTITFEHVADDVPVTVGGD